MSRSSALLVILIVLGGGLGLLLQNRSSTPPAPSSKPAAPPAPPSVAAAPSPPPAAPAPAPPAAPAISREGKAPLPPEDAPTNLDDAASAIRALSPEPQPAPGTSPPAPGTETSPTIKLLEEQIAYLQNQVNILRKENSDLLDKLASLTQPATPATPGAPAPALPQPGKSMPPCTAPEPEDGKESPDFIGIGIELVKTRELKDVPIPTISVDRSVVEQHIARWLGTQFTPDHGKLQGRALAALGAIPDPVDTVALKAQFLSHQIGAWYVPEEQTLYLASAGEAPVGMEVKENALGLGYAYLFKRVAAKLFPPEAKGLTLDARLARESLLAGDASLTRFLHALKHPKTGGGGGVGEDPDDPSRSVPIPNYLRQPELAAFSAGFDYVQALHSIGGWEQVNAAYGRVPIAGAEVLDTELYLNETPFVLQPIEVGDALVDGVAPFWKDTLGTMGTVILLRQHAPEPIAADTAPGWANDLLLAYPSKTGGREHAVWQTRWRTTNGADSFFSAMRQAQLSRYKGATPKTDAGEGVFHLESGGRTVIMQRNANGLGVLFIDAGDAGFAKAAAAKFGK